MDPGSSTQLEPFSQHDGHPAAPTLHQHVLLPAEQAGKADATATAAADAAAARAKRRRTTGAELAILEDEFAQCDKPDPLARERISKRIGLVEGPGMNGREIQVWFQNKRQAVRKARGSDASLLVVTAGDVPALSASTSTTSLSSSSSDLEKTVWPQVQAVNKGGRGTGYIHLAKRPDTTGLSATAQTKRPRRLASLQLQDLDGHAELRFQPPCAPSPVSPPRIPGAALLTRKFQRLQQQELRADKKRRQLVAARSVSSPALLGERAPHSASVSKQSAARTKLAKSTSMAAAGKENVDPHTTLSAQEMADAHEFAGTAQVQGWQGLLLATSARYLPASPSHLRDLPPSASRDNTHGNGQGRRVVSAPATAVSPCKIQPNRQEEGLPGASQETCVDDEEGEVMDHAMSLEECALSLVGLARGS